MPFDQHWDSMFKRIANLPINEFKQGVHVGDEPQAVNDLTRGQSWQLPASIYSQVKGGFCLGASLDWLRKVLQHEDGRTNIDHLKASRVMRMAKTQIKHKELFNSSSRTAPLDARMTGVDSRLKNAAAMIETKKRIAQALRSDFEAWIHRNGGTCDGGRYQMRGNAETLGVFHEKNQQLDEVEQALNTAIDEENEIIDEWNALSNEKDALVHTWNDASAAERRAMLWNELATGFGADAGKKRKFTGISPVASCSTQSFDGLRDFLESALSAPGFTSGRGMLLSFSFEPPPGHAVVLHRESEDTTLLFDPNLGVYKFQDFRRLVIALVILVDKGYLGYDASKKTTTELGSSHSWQIFARTDKLIPDAFAERWHTQDDVVLAHQDALLVMQRLSEAAKEKFGTSLRKAVESFARFNANKGPETQKAWIASHNEATLAFRELRTDDTAIAKIQATYPRFNGRTITLG